jgi:transposase
VDKEHRMLKAKQFQSQGLKQWQIAEEMDVSERTVRNYLKREPVLRARKKKKSKLDLFKLMVKEILDENPYYNAVVLQERLVKQGYTGKISILRDFVKEERKRITMQAVLRYETEPGHQAQVDWKEFGIQILDGKWQKLYAFVMTLGYSRRMFVCFTTSMKESVFLACHVLAFIWFGGIPQRILYDNAKTAFVRCEGGGFEPNKRLLAFSCHYGFIPKRCRVRRPQTKGKVERSIGYLGNNFWQSLEGKPLSIAFLNEDVALWLSEADLKPIGGMNETRNERFVREREHLKALPGSDFDTREEVPVMVSRESLVRFESNSYSIHPDYIGEMLVLKVDRMKMEAEFLAEGLSLKKIRLFDKGNKLKLIDTADREALIERWESDRRRMENIRRPRKKHPHRDIPFEVVVRSPGEYDALCGIAREEAI